MEELIFELELLLCERFPSMDPLQINECNAEEVFQLIRDLNAYSERKETPKAAGEDRKTKKRNMVKVMD